MTAAICLWSGPRNVSTALMYSFAQNEHVAVIDEPLEKIDWSGVYWRRRQA